MYPGEDGGWQMASNIAQGELIRLGVWVECAIANGCIKGMPYVHW